MIKNVINIRVRYAETDRMGFVYYGNYATYFEMGRVELLRQVGMSYRVLEDQGVILPVRDFTIRYRKPAVYDDLLQLTTEMHEMPNRRINFNYQLHNEAGDLLATADTTLVFVDKASSRPIHCPDYLSDMFSPYFQA